MKKKFSILIVSTIIAGIIVSLWGVALVSQAAPNERLSRPIPATDVKIVKKTPLPAEIGEIKGKPATPSGKEKNGGPAATGVLGATTTGAKYAVVIGICDYPGTAYDIGTCKSDGDSLNMYDALVTLYGYNPGDIYLFRDMATSTGTTTVNRVPFTSYPATYDAIHNAVNSINATSGSEVVFFFSGHGADGIAQDNDAETRDEGIVVHDGTNLVVIWDGELRSWFNGFGTTRIVFVFDSCLAGGMNDVAAEVRVVNMATGETQPAYVYSGGEFGEGVFSHYFVNEGMLQGLADGYNQLNATDTDVAVEEAFDYAKVKITIPRQKPVISDNFSDDLLL